ncbi:hypothetical protein TELCIR_24356 [Teladorsagia circumcincta]|uniref:Uncharacterized protein n=1 Tax=Teladorsagia circumcincta TaxID=45464 RepID=A0A2G9T8M2_TELCI|nr:hypothetical protein TELCIR_24356 [Teladorsagia circumcincta]
MVSSRVEDERKQNDRNRDLEIEEKRDTLKKLRKYALDKNEDEYHHHMINSEVKKVTKEPVIRCKIQVCRLRDSYPVLLLQLGQRHLDSVGTGVAMGGN